MTIILTGLKDSFVFPSTNVRNEDMSTCAFRCIATRVNNTDKTNLSAHWFVMRKAALLQSFQLLYSSQKIRIELG